jgi:hypothetical protein
MGTNALYHDDGDARMRMSHKNPVRFEHNGLLPHSGRGMIWLMMATKKRW